MPFPPALKQAPKVIKSHLKPDDIAKQFDLMSLPTPLRSSRYSGVFSKSAALLLAQKPSSQHTESNANALQQVDEGGDEDDVFTIDTRGSVVATDQEVSNLVVMKPKAASSIPAGSRWRGFGKNCRARTSVKRARFSRRKLLQPFRKNQNRKWKAKQRPPLVPPREQIEYYFSRANILDDKYLQSRMDAEGWVSLHEIVSFPRMRRLGVDLASAIAFLIDSESVELSGDQLCVRVRNEKLRIAVQIAALQSAMQPSHALGDSGKCARDGLQPKSSGLQQKCFSKQQAQSLKTCVVKRVTMGVLSKSCQFKRGGQLLQKVRDFSKARQLVASNLRSPPPLHKQSLNNALCAKAVLRNPYISLKSAPSKNTCTNHAVFAKASLENRHAMSKSTSSKSTSVIAKASAKVCGQECPVVPALKSPPPKACLTSTASEDPHMQVGSSPTNGTKVTAAPSTPTLATPSTPRALTESSSPTYTPPGSPCSSGGSSPARHRPIGDASSPVSCRSADSPLRSCETLERNNGDIQ